MLLRYCGVEVRGDVYWARNLDLGSMGIEIYYMTNESEQTKQLEIYYREYGPLILRYLYRRVGSEAAADMVQDVFVEAARHYTRLVKADSPRGWLLKVAYYQMCNYYRRKRQVYELPADLVVDKVVEDDAVSELREALKLVDESSREILMLRWYEQLSYEDIAQVLELPVGTVRSRLHYSLKKLREIMSAKETI